MKKELVYSLTQNFESYAQTTNSGVEFWLARDLQHLLGYAKWDNFQTVISKAKTACELSGHEISDHFADVGKMVELGSGSRREIADVMLISKEHVTNNRAVRDTLISRGIQPEELPPSEDVVKVARRLTSAGKKIINKPDILDSD